MCAVEGQEGEVMFGETLPAFIYSENGEEVR
jgi:hypothetical protein